jgi:hypothetical protein
MRRPKKYCSKSVKAIERQLKKIVRMTMSREKIRNFALLPHRASSVSVVQTRIKRLASSGIMRNKHGTAMSSSNDPLVLKTKRLSPFGRDFERSGGDLMREKHRE